MRDRLAELLDHPELALALDVAAAAAVLARVEGLGAVLRVRLAAPGPQATPLENGHEAGNRLLSAEEVALRLGLDVAAVARRRFPFTVRMGRRTVRYSEAGLEAWLRAAGGARR